MKVPSKASLSQQGFSLVQLVVGTSLTGLLMLSAAQVLVQAAHLKHHGQAAKSLLDVRQLLIELIMDPRARENTINDLGNISMDCLRTNVTCQASGWQFIRMRDGASTSPNIVPVVDDPTDRKLAGLIGFDADGQRCELFGINKKICPFQARLSWKPVCDGACSGPTSQIRWRISLNHQGTGAASKRVQNWSFEVITNRNVLSGNRILKLEVGVWSNCVLYADTRAKCWGSGGSGMLGSGATVNQSRPEYVLDMSGSPLTGIVDIQLSRTSACALMSDGRVQCWGGNDWGQLGRGLPATLPIAHRFSWVANDNTSELTPGYVRTANAVGSELTGVTKLHAGSNHFCAEKDNREIYCWGDLYNFWFPVNLAAPDFPAGDYNANQPAAASYPARAFPNLDDTSLFDLPDVTTPVMRQRYYSWDESKNTTIGYGPFPDPPVVGVASPESDRYPHYGEFRRLGFARPLYDIYNSGDSFEKGSEWSDFGTGQGVGCFIIFGTGEVSCLGWNSGGQVLPQPENFKVFGFHRDRRVVDEMDALGNGVGQAVHDVRSLQVGGEHVCGQMSDGRLLCWGENQYGQVGRGGNPTECYVDSDGVLFNCAPHFVVDKVSSVPISFDQFHLGWYTSCGVKDGEGYCWGKGWYGELGDEEDGDSSVISPMGHRSLAAQKIQLSTINSTLPAKFRSVKPGFFHTCALLENDEVWCWGRNHRGQLGRGFESSHEPIRAPVQGL